MSDQDKPFICYKSGWGMKIVPRNAAGRRAVIMWMIAYLVPTGGFVWLMVYYPRPAIIAAATVSYLIITGIWLIAMIRWLMARSEIVDLRELLELKREQDRAKRRRP
jgi:hypothetical protein